MSDIVLPPPRIKKAKSKITVRVFAQDITILRQTYAEGGYNKIIRALIRDHVIKLTTLSGENLESAKVDITLGEI